MKNVAIAILVGVIAVGSAMGGFATSRTVDTTASVEVRVWQNTRDAQRLYISSRREGGGWKTVPLAMSGNWRGKYRYSDIALDVPVSVSVELDEAQIVSLAGDLDFPVTFPEGMPLSKRVGYVEATAATLEYFESIYGEDSVSSPEGLFVWETLANGPSCDASGCYIGRTIHIWDADALSFRRHVRYGTVAHEYFHHLQNHWANGKSHWLLIEGFATYANYRFEDSVSLSAVYWGEVSNERYTTLDGKLARYEGQYHHGALNNCYPLDLGMSDDLQDPFKLADVAYRDEVDWLDIRAFYEGIGRGLSPGDSFYEVFGVTADEWLERDEERMRAICARVEDGQTKLERWCTNTHPRYAQNFSHVRFYDWACTEPY